MKLRSMVFAILVTSGLAVGCGNSSGSNEPGKDSHKNKTQGSREDRTDYSQCNQGPAPRSIEGAWKQDFHEDDIDSTLSIEIFNSTIRVHNDCYIKGHHLRATAQTQAHYTNSILKILGSDEARERITEGDFEMNCNASISPAELQYSFRGSCLVLSQGGQEMVMVPAY